jgi:hypothetical protein
LRLRAGVTPFWECQLQQPEREEGESLYEWTLRSAWTLRLSHQQRIQEQSRRIEHKGQQRDSQQAKDSKAK